MRKRSIFIFTLSLLSCTIKIPINTDAAPEPYFDVIDIGLSNTFVVRAVYYKSTRAGVPEFVESSGTGFVVRHENLVATAAHVVSGAIQIFADVYRWDKGSHRRILTHSVPLQVMFVYPRADLAFLFPTRPRYYGLLPAPFPLAFSYNPSIPLIGFGYTAGWRELFFYKQFRDRDRIGCIQLTPGSHSGDSGGPVLNHRGEVVGLISSVNPERTITRAIPLWPFWKTLDRLAEERNRG